MSINQKSQTKNYPKLKGGDKLTLNLTGSTNSNKITNTGQTPTSPITRLFPSPPPSANATNLQSDMSTMFPLDLLQDIDNNPITHNGKSTTPATTPSATNDTVTVTHFSEKRGTMEKISVPSLNIFNAEFRANESNKVTTPPSVAAKVSTNPFLNQSSSISITTSPTNPFHVSLATTIVDSEMASSMNNNTKTIDSILNCSDKDNNSTIIATITKIDSSQKVNATNPFTVAIDENDHENNRNGGDRIKVNITDAFNNYKNNNSVVKDQVMDSLFDERNKNKKNIEVIFFSPFNYFMVVFLSFFPVSFSFVNIRFVD